MTSRAVQILYIGNLRQSSYVTKTSCYFSQNFLAKNQKLYFCQKTAQISDRDFEKPQNQINYVTKTSYDV